MIESITHCGKLIHECSLQGETRTDDVFPAHCNAIQVSRNRWLIVYATRGFDGVDDDRSIVYQLRESTPDGRIIREGWLSRCVDDWQPLGDGTKFRKEHGHPVAFGVPKGAARDEVLLPSQNVFAVKWRVLGKFIAAGVVGFDVDLLRRTQGVEWVQFRLNAAEDDIEVLQPVRALRQKGYENGAQFCERDVQWMNQTFVQAVPLDAYGARWADVNHFDGGRIAPLEYSFNGATGLYEWTRTGALLGGGEHELYEASLALQRNGGRKEWIIAARKHREGTVWRRAEDLFSDRFSSPVLVTDPLSYAPIGVYTCADGVLRLMTGDPQASPYGNGRNPLYIWDMETTEGFSTGERRVLFDAKAAAIPIRPEAGTVVDMPKILPHAGGREQFFVHRLRPKAINFPANTKVAANAAEKGCAGIYYGIIRYTADSPAMWEFAGENQPAIGDSPAGSSHQGRAEMIHGQR